VVVYTAHSALNITYLAWGARASEDSPERTQLIAFREGFGLFGIILASLLPALFTQWLGLSTAWLSFSLVFAVLLLGAVWTLLRHAPCPSVVHSVQQDLFHPLRQRAFRRLAILLFLNGLAIALAATLSLFYIADVLQAEPYSGGFLALYFISGAASLPLWLYLARRMGRPKAWMLGSALAVAGFVWAVQLGAGDLLPYMAICLLAGAALGADLALPAAIAADTIPPQDQGLTGGYFGIWSLINKAVLALAAGMALPLLAWFGYQPGATTGTTSLAVLYAGVPCLIKLTTLALLIRWRTSLEVKHAV
jgi:Na+/melibiose symporter-like transporter